ncbi:TonB-dependent receptor [Cesiribacter sp. SM1]|uniref:TonB-dependent receptor n=1 Tax=Cesiribacter sp. SM1 TaxID=2861196 RepID=UPI001CD75830|nr:TonB-dependent receptor [Cesiribacter sp. SM1]
MKFLPLPQSNFISILALALLLLPFVVKAQQPVKYGAIEGHVISTDSLPRELVAIRLKNVQMGTTSDANGAFHISQVPAGSYQLEATLVGYTKINKEIQVNAGETTYLTLVVNENLEQLQVVEVFGVPDEQPVKLSAITRLPLKPSDQIQSISIISDELIKKQGALTITEAIRNVPGVYSFATYGNKRESLSSRGFRGIPVLKNGVRVNSDFRGIGFITDMEGVESIQVIKGANAITQGGSYDIGSAGGVVNIVTKTPKFYQGGYAALRVGSWERVRPSFDVYGPINESKTVAFRLNGAYERANSYRTGVSLNKVYVNPSLEWRPDDKTSLTLEMDYLNDSRTPDLGTIALSNDEYSIYELPHDKFLGFETDRTNTLNTTYAARFNRTISDNLSVRAAYFHSTLDVQDLYTSLSSGNRRNPLPGHTRQRALAQSGRLDKNSVVQFDLVGQDVTTGLLKHTFQVGADISTFRLETPTYASTIIDTINVYEGISNRLPGEAPASALLSTTSSNGTRLGLMAQDVISISEWAKVTLGLRYSTQESTSSATAEVVQGEGFTPLAGLIVTPVKGLNLFASYTNTFNPRSASRLDKDGNELGNERIDQIEAGVKSDWFYNRLRFNLTLYKINNKNMNLQAVELDENGVLVYLPYYIQGGNDERKGVEVELLGRVMDNLELVAGYSYIDAQYKEHTTYVEGSAPLNTPKHTANLWANYTIKTSLFRGVTLGAGAYYIGERPINDWTKEQVEYHGITPGLKPFNVKAYTLVNASVAYQIKDISVRLLFNNIFDEVGYNAYRTSFINPVDPRNFAGVLTYRF